MASSAASSTARFHVHNRNPRQLLLPFGAALLLSACSSLSGTEHPDTDGLEDGPAAQEGLAPSASMQAQSPINILTHAVQEERPGHAPRLNCNDEVVAVENLGHTVQLDLAPGSWVAYDGQHYAMQQAHFHTPSEHQLDGMTFPLEMHVVHVPESGPVGSAPSPSPYLVLGFLFKMGEPCAFLEAFLDRIPEEDHSMTPLPSNHVRLLDLLDAFPEHGLDHYYHYVGSLTTAPYTEGVQWFLSEHIFEAAPEQIERLRALEGENARSAQALNGRSIDHH